jgi:class 3 adenylate cyclase
MVVRSPPQSRGACGPRRAGRWLCSVYLAGGRQWLGARVGGVQTPETRYADRSDGVSIAYQVFGDGPVNLVYCGGFMSHLDLQWTNPLWTRFFRRLASFSRVAVYDKAGTGLSDPIAHVPTLEERMEEIRTVMDAAGMHRAALFGESEGGPSALLFAAAHPARTVAIVVYGSMAKADATAQELAPFGGGSDVLAARMAEMKTIVGGWGHGRTLELLAPSLAGSRPARMAMATFERAALSPGMARGLLQSYASIDITGVLALTSVPTLVLHRRNDAWIPIAAGRYLASQVPGARFAELDGGDHTPTAGDSTALLDEVERFLTGTTTRATPDRVLATVLFTDIVESTARASSLGDTHWRDLLERHDELVRACVESAGGRVIKRTGDGALARFDGPGQAIAAADELLRDVAQLGLQLRVGVHSGECEVIGDDLAGLAVHIGARVAAKAAPGELLVSSTVTELLVGSGLRFTDRGVHHLKGVPGEWRLHALAEQEADSSPRRIEPPGVRMTPADKATVRLARRVPGVLRTMGQLTLGKSGRSARQ